jgi:putative SOS response-associated peptidase YedK
MCNHYRKGQKVIEWTQTRLGGVKVAAALTEIAEHTFPKYPAPIVIREGSERILTEMRWGIPRVIGQGRSKPVTNARNDRLTSRTWRECLQRRRCLIPATGYFEPGMGPVGRRGEILFTVREQPVFFLAGLWERDGDKGEETFAMVTTEPNATAARFHDRMPLAFNDEQAEQWLGDEALSPKCLAELCRGLPAEALLAHELPPLLRIVRPERKQKAQSKDEPELF